MWSKALPLTASCLSPMPGFESLPGQVRKLPVTQGQMVVFAAGYSVFLYQLQLASHDNMAEKGMKIKIPSKVIRRGLVVRTPVNI